MIQVSTWKNDIKVQYLYDKASSGLFERLELWGNSILKLKINQVSFIFNTSELFSEYKKLTILNTSGTNLGEPDLLVVQHHDNQLHII